MKNTDVLSYPTLIEKMPNPAVIFVANENLDILYSNGLLWHLFECESEAEFMSYCKGSFRNVISQSDALGMLTLIEEGKRLQNHSSHKQKYHIVTKYGVEKEIEDQGTVLKMTDEGPLLFNQLFEFSHEQSHISRSKFEGVLSKEQFNTYVERIIRQAESKEEQGQYSIIYNNIRNFKYFNMKYGRAEGDMLLQHLANQLKDMHGVLMLGWAGGDRFYALANNHEVEQALCEGSQLFQKAFDGSWLKLQSGIYRFTRKGIDIELACDLAKIACDNIYNLTDSVVTYDNELEHRLFLENFIDEHFEKALQNGYIKPYYQPVIRVISGEVCGAEALTRWHDPETGIISPAVYIPILERKNLITKHDLSILEQVCKDQSRLSKDGKNLIPVSFNLSKLDLLDHDIFEKVNSIVMQYHVPKDLLNIEITESVVMNEPDRIKEVISQFQTAGYHVWMDDFGSELSSLNVLDEYSFDEIKLDMLFLHQFDEKSKQIIRSVIQMAKRLKVQTLSEGVESKAQFEFLKEIGCEKAQGYYISKPLPLDDLLQLFMDRNMTLEQRSMRQYYDTIGTIDHITNRTLAIVQYDQKEFRFLFMNPEFERVSKVLGNGEFIFTEYMLNSNASNLSAKFLALQDETRSHPDFVEMDYSIYGKYFRLRSKSIARVQGYEANLVEIEDLTRSEVDEKKEQMDYIFRMMYSMYDDIFLLDENSGFINVQSNSNIHHETRWDDVISRNEIADNYVLLEDQEEFMNFTDPSTLKERLRHLHGGYETRYFRNKTRNGSYIWKANTIQYISEKDILIYSTRQAYLEDPRLMQKIFPNSSVDCYESIDYKIWNTLKYSKTLNLFWKDTNRRFLGVNEKFLKTYGLHSQDQVIGKTDEQMHWHVDDGPFRDDEYKVLEKGEKIVNEVGKCIIRGVLHTIMVTKEPIYQSGKIVGLIGYFIDVDEISTKYGNPEVISFIDVSTGLLSVHGMTNALATYMDAWIGRRENFAVIHVEFKEYERLFGSYGNSIINRMSAEVGEILKTVFGNDTTIAHIYSGTFVLLKKYSDKSEIDEITTILRKRMRDIHSLAGYSATINPVIQVAYAEDDDDLDHLTSLATGSTAISTELDLLAKKDYFSYKKDEFASILETNNNEVISSEKEFYTVASLKEKYEDSDFWVYVSDMANDELVYVNRALRNVYVRFFGEKANDLGFYQKKRCYEVMHDSAVPCAMCTKYKLHFSQYLEREFYDFQFKQSLKLKDKIIEVDGRDCAIEITDLNAKTETQVQESLLNDLLRKALYEHNPDRSIAILLEYFGRYIGCDRAYINEQEGSDYVRNTYEWCRFGIIPKKNERQHTNLEQLLFREENVMHGNLLIMKDLEMYRDSAPSFYQRMKEENIHSLVMYPIWRDGKYGGFYGFENPDVNRIDSVHPILQTIGHFIEVLMISRDLIDQLEYISFSDQMTGFGNRFAFEQYRQKLVTDKSIGIVFCDVTGLKMTNDTYGHDAGDKLLLRAASAISESFGEHSLFRVGGDEFMVLASDISREDFQQRLDQLRELSSKNHAPLAIGSTWKQAIHKEDIPALIKLVDQRMYEDKAKYYAENPIKHA